MFHNRHLVRTGTVAAVALALFAPAAQAGTQTPDDWAVRPAPSAAIVPATGQQRLPDDRANRPQPASLAEPPVVVVHSTSGAGFAWGDAAIGAAAMLGLTLVAGAATAGVRSRRRELAA